MLKRLRGRARLALAGGLVVALVVGLTAVYAVVSPSRALGAQATLTILTGTVELREASSGSFGAAADGGVLGPGATVRTGADGNAIITFFDGSTVTVEPSSELTLEQLETTSDGNMLISVLQTVGRSWHVIGHKLTEGSQYQVRTPTATASVRGTAFEFDVDPNGDAQALTGEGLVELSSEGLTVPVAPDQLAIAPANEPPSEPVDAPPPENVVKVIIDPTNSAAAVDSKGRAVGLVDGKPNITVPRGKVEYIGGKIVMSVPVQGDERVSTVVQAPDPTKAVAIQTQFESNGVVVNNTMEVRAPGASGLAFGGGAKTSAGWIVLPDAEAKFIAPKIAHAPQVQPTGGLFGGQVAFPSTERLADLPQVQMLTLPAGAAAPTTFALPEGVTLPADYKIGEFQGGFQQNSFFGFTQNVTKQAGFDPTKAQGLEFASRGIVAAPTTLNYATFAGELPAGLIPAAPPGATGLDNAAGFVRSGFTFPPVQAPTTSGPGAATFDPSLIPALNLSPEVQQQMAQQLAQFQQIATQLQQQGAFSAPTGAAGVTPADPAAPGQAPIRQGPQGQTPFSNDNPFGGANPFAGGNPFAGVGPSPFQTTQGELARGCRSAGILGVICDTGAAAGAAAPNVQPGFGPTIDCPTGTVRSQTGGCAPTGQIGAPAIDCPTGTVRSQTGGCAPTDQIGAPTIGCPTGTVRTQTGGCAPEGQTGSAPAIDCPTGTVRTQTGGCAPAGQIGAPTIDCPTGTVRTQTGGCAPANQIAAPTVGCPAGTVRTQTGGCAPSDQPLTQPTAACPAGYVPTSTGGCAPSDQQQIQPTTECPAGYVKTSTGGCAPSDQQTQPTNTCPAGTTGTYPDCRSTTTQPTQSCPAGTTGTYPDCRSTETAPTQTCPAGTTGTYPNCQSTTTQPTQTCPSGTTGTYPDCQSTTTQPTQQSCPPGTSGTYPNCVSDATPAPAPTDNTTPPAPGSCPPGTSPQPDGRCAYWPGAWLEWAVRISEEESILA